MNVPMRRAPYSNLFTRCPRTLFNLFRPALLDVGIGVGLKIVVFVGGGWNFDVRSLPSN